MVAADVTASCRSVAHRYDWTVTERSVISVALSPEDAADLRLWAERTGTTVSGIMREGMRYPLERARAEWLERHRGDPEVWGEVTAIQTGAPRDLKSVFGVRLTAEQMRDILPAAEAWNMPLSAFLREAALRLAAAMAEGGTAHCPGLATAGVHLSVGGVTSAECATCGPLPVTYAVVA